MAKRSWMLVKDQNAWRIFETTTAPGQVHPLELNDDATVEQVAQAATQTLSALDYRHEGLLLGLDACECLSSRIAIDDPSLTRNRQSMLYEFEQWLPMAAEDVVADFIFHAHAALGIAVQTTSTKPLVDALENNGVLVQSIVPSAILALQQCLRANPGEGTFVVILGQGEQIHWFLVTNNKPETWELLSAEPHVLSQRLELESLSHAGPLTVVSYHLSAELDDLLFMHPDVKVVHNDNATDPNQYAAALAKNIILGTETPLVELRRDSLASGDPYRLLLRPIRFAMVAAAISLMVLTIGFEYRAYRYRLLASNLVAKQIEIFRETLPGKSISKNDHGEVRTQLSKEKVKLAGVKEKPTDLSTPPSGLFLMHELLAAMPENLRCCLLEIRLQHGRILLDGELPSHGDADVLATSLRNRGFKVQPPHTQQLSDRGVTVQMTALWQDKAALHEGGGS